MKTSCLSVTAFSSSSLFDLRKSFLESLKKRKFSNLFFHLSLSNSSNGKFDLLTCHGRWWPDGIDQSIRGTGSNHALILRFFLFENLGRYAWKFNLYWSNEFKIKLMDFFSGLCQ